MNWNLFSALSFLALSLPAVTIHDVFSDSFTEPAAWPVVANYENKLKISFVPKSAEEGSCLRVSGEEVPKCDTAWNVMTAPRPLGEKGGYYRFAFRVKARRAMVTGAQEGAPWWTSVRWFAADGSQTNIHRVAWSVPANTSREVVHLGEVPPWAASYQIQIGCDVPNVVEGNVVKISEVRLGVFDSKAPSAGTWLPPVVKMLTPSPTTDVQVPLKLSVASDAEVDWTSLQIVLDGEDATKRFARAKDCLTYTAQGESWSAGLHRVDVSVADQLGLRTECSKFFFLGEAPKTPRVTLRDDGMTLVDGEPFFPVGIYGVMRRAFNAYNFDRAFADLKAGGFNFAHSYASPHETEFLDAAWKQGIRIWNVARFPDARFIDVERHHPAILAWYLGDDTSANTTPQELCDYNDAVRAVDPTRITTQADGVASDAPVSNYAPFVDGTDNFLAEIYPVYHDTPEARSNCVARVIRDMKRVRADVVARGGSKPRSCWPIIQYFKGWGWERFPAKDELDAMSFASLIHGAHGITWYTYGGTVEPENKKFNYGITTSFERWTNMTNLATRISSLVPVLVERTPPAQPTVAVVKGPQEDPFGNPSVTCLLKRHADKAYLFTVNATGEPVEAMFTLAGVGTPADVLWENRSVVCAEGRLTDTFAPFAVHVYVLASEGKR